VALDGQGAPGGGRYVEFGTPAVGAGNRVAFVASTAETKTTLFLSSGGGTAPLAKWGARTGTRIAGVFHGFDTPAASGGSVTFRATLQQSRQAIFLARGHCRMAIAGTGESDPSGGRFTSFAPPTFAGGDVIFRGNVAGGAAPIALYRATLAGSCTAVPPTLDTLIIAGVPSSPLDLGPPTGNRSGALVLTTDETGAGPTDTILLLTP
jgi:hypothetical protein